VAARSGRVGVDLDRAGAIRREHVRYFADRHEQAAWRRADPTALWALKEAAWKALRLGPEVPFSALQLRFGRGGELIRVRHAGATYSARAALGRPWPGYLLAVVQLGERA
jgi:phosphopantetheinyl transferase (holo-ACP synthase)